MIPSAQSPERIQLARGQELDLRGCDIAVDHAVPIAVRGANDTLTIRVPPLPIYTDIPERVLGHRDVLGRLEAVFSGPNRGWPDDERGRGWSGEEIIAAFLRGFLHE